MSKIVGVAPLRALIYNRVSSDPTGRGISVASQDSENRGFCRRQGWAVVHAVTDNDRSASRYATRGRDGYSEVRRAIASGEIDVFVCWEASRADRDLEAYAQMRNVCATAKVLWAYSGRVYDLNRTDDRFTTGMDVLLAEREAGTTRDRIKRGINSAAAQGKPHGTVPYGYRRERDSRTGAITAQVPDPDTAPVVEEIVARVAAGEALHSIVADLNRRAIPTPQDHKDRPAGPRRLWTSATVRSLLRSRSILGIRTHLGQAHAVATWEPIVSAADFARATAVLADPHRARHHRGVAPKHLLSGIAECGVCGAWLRAEVNRGRPVYQCRGHGPGDPRGKGHVSRGPREMLEAMVVAWVLARLSDPGWGQEVIRRETAAGAQVSTAAAELAELQARMSEFEISARNVKGPAAAVVVGIIADYATQIETVQARLSGAAGVPQVVSALAGPDATRRWYAISGDLPRQRQAIRALVRVVVHRSTRGRGVRGFDPSTIDIINR